jgi:hypothetical protein
MELGTRDALIERLSDRIRGLDDVERGMLRHYRKAGPDEPVEAHVAGGGDADREVAYSRNRRLRQAELVEHAGRGEYEYALPALVEREYDDRLHAEDRRDVVRAVEESFVESTDEKEDRADAASVAEPETGDTEILPSERERESPAFRRDDAEFVEDAELVGERETESERRDPASTDGGERGTDSDAVVVEETTPASDGLQDRSEPARDAEFVD